MVVKNQKRVEDDKAYMIRLREIRLPGFSRSNVPSNLKDLAQSKFSSREALNYILSLDVKDPEISFAKCYVLENPKIGVPKLIDFLLRKAKADTVEDRSYITSTMRNESKYGMEDVFAIIRRKFIGNKETKKAYVMLYEMYKTRVLLRKN